MSDQETRDNRLKKFKKIRNPVVRDMISKREFKERVIRSPLNDYKREKIDIKHIEDYYDE